MKPDFYDTKTRTFYYSEDQMKEAFEAGRRYGRDEMHGNTLKYPDEIKVLNFDEWIGNKKVGEL